MSEYDVTPKLIMVKDASYLKAQKGKKKKQLIEKEVPSEKIKQKHNNKKGSVITQFSRNSRKNMMYTICRIKRDCLPSFVTLTYPKTYSNDANEWKRDLDTFTKRLGRRFPEVSGVWKLEPQKRGAPHFHLLVWGASCQELQEFVPYAWYELAGGNDMNHLLWHLGKAGNGNIHCVQEVSTQKAMFQYVVKYINKASIEGWKNVGRWWGMFFRERLPFGEELTFEITEKDAVQIMRYIRRFTHHRSWNGQSRQMACDANQWMEKLQTIPMGTYKDWLKKVEET